MACTVLVPTILLDKMQSETISYQMPTQSLPGLKWSDHIADLVELSDFLGSRGIQTKNTRIESISNTSQNSSPKGQRMNRWYSRIRQTHGLRVVSTGCCMYCGKSTNSCGSSKV